VPEGALLPVFARVPEGALRLALCLSLAPALSLAACAEPQYLAADGAPGAEGLGSASGLEASVGAADGALDSADASAALPNASFSDASTEPVRSDAACIDKPSVLGAECPGVVWCTDLGPCDQREKICCLTPLSADCSARDDCGLEQRARCDGPEDCLSGNVCCMRDGATLCSEQADCPESQRACHSNADCAAKQCARGWPGMFGGVPVTYFADWGFCRMQ